MYGTVVLTNYKLVNMSSPENDEKAVRRTSVSNLANFFEEALTGSNENKSIKRRSIDRKSSIVTTTDTEIVLEVKLLICLVIWIFLINYNIYIYMPMHGSYKPLIDTKRVLL